ncbi:hypothetical protein DXG01_008086 [Tephrocybe rancida]|nr:hypothetical protein DXG01_008086 [Tephrocybe rancida]
MGRNLQNRPPGRDVLVDYWQIMGQYERPISVLNAEREVWSTVWDLATGVSTDYRIERAFAKLAGLNFDDATGWSFVDLPNTFGNIPPSPSPQPPILSGAFPTEVVGGVNVMHPNLHAQPVAPSQAINMASEGSLFGPVVPPSLAKGPTSDPTPDVDIHVAPSDPQLPSTNAPSPPESITTQHNRGAGDHYISAPTITVLFSLLPVPYDSSISLGPTGSVSVPPESPFDTSVTPAPMDEDPEPNPASQPPRSQPAQDEREHPGAGDPKSAPITTTGATAVFEPFGPPFAHSSGAGATQGETSDLTELESGDEDDAGNEAGDEAGDEAADGDESSKKELSGRQLRPRPSVTPDAGSSGGADSSSGGSGGKPKPLKEKEPKPKPKPVKEKEPKPKPPKDKEPKPKPAKEKEKEPKPKPPKDKEPKPTPAKEKEPKPKPPKDKELKPKPPKAKEPKDQEPEDEQGTDEESDETSELDEEVRYLGTRVRVTPVIYIDLTQDSMDEAMEEKKSYSPLKIHNGGPRLRSRISTEFFMPNCKDESLLYPSAHFDEDIYFMDELHCACLRTEDLQVLSHVWRIPYEEYKDMTTKQVMDIFRHQSILITNVDSKKMSFKEAIYSLKAIDEELVVIDQSIYEPDTLLHGDEDEDTTNIEPFSPTGERVHGKSFAQTTSRHCLGTLRQVMESVNADNPKSLNVLDITAKSDKIPEQPLFSDKVAWDHIPAKAGENYPTSDMRWALASSGWTQHRWHQDSNGLATVVTVQSGMKWWYIGTPRKGIDPSQDCGGILRFLDGFDLDE